MTANATRTHEVLNALVASWQADAGISALGSVSVVDGPYCTDNSSRYRLFVGSNGLDEDDTSATVSQVSPHATDVARDEEITIPCAAWYTSGDTAMGATRQNAQNLLNLAVTMPRATQNLALANIFYVGFDSIALRQVQTTDGAAAIYTFTVTVRCRIY